MLKIGLVDKHKSCNCFYGKTFLHNKFLRLSVSVLSAKMKRICSYLFFFCFLGPHSRQVEVPRLGVQSELQLPATATATPDPSCICDLHHSSWQPWILNPLSKVRDWTRNLIVPSRIRFHWATTGTPVLTFRTNMKIDPEFTRIVYLAKSWCSLLYLLGNLPLKAV